MKIEQCQKSKADEQKCKTEKEADKNPVKQKIIQLLVEN